MKKQKILVVDDERDVITGFRRVFDKDNVDIISAYSGHEAIQILKDQTPDLVVMDLRMPGLDGLATLKQLREINPKLLVILMTAFSTSANVIEAMKNGAYDYLVKPFSVTKLREVIFEALKLSEDMKTAVNYEPRLGEEEMGDLIIGKSEAMQGVYKMIGQVATSNATVLITGESGTGKELAARAVFSHSERSRKPFVAVNCAAIPESLLESELFGHEKGAFTSAASRRIGKFEMANEGTLFLDEIGDMSLATQTKILRVLQSGEFERIGGSETIRVDVRIIAATNRNLEQMMEEGKFRPDLFYRLNVVRLELPALRDRREDIPLLIEHFLHRELSGREDRKLNISASAMDKLTVYSWPGNVRELENTIRNAVLTAKSDTILASDIRLKEDSKESLPRPGTRTELSSPPALDNTSDGLFKEEDPETQAENQKLGDLEHLLGPIFDHLMDARERGHEFSFFDIVERTFMILALRHTRGNQMRAARILGITRSTLRKRMERYEINLDNILKGRPKSR